MTALPPSSDLVNTGIPKGTFKGALSGMRAYLSGLFGDTGTQATALTALGALLNGSLSKTTAYTVVLADRGKMIDCSGTWTLAIDAVGTLGAGFAFGFRNSGTGVITINPYLSEQIDGVATVDIGPGESGLVMVDGAGLKTIGRVSINGALRSVQVFTSTGAYVKPVGLKRVNVRVFGGGGGSGGVASDTGVTSYSGPGGPGGWSEKVIEAASLAASEAVTVGAGGAAGASTPGNGGSGGTSSFGAHCSATGGGGGSLSSSLDKRTGVGTAGIGSGGNLNGRGFRVADGSGQGAGSFFGPGVSGAGDVPAAGGSSRSFTNLGSAVGYVGAPGIVIVEEFF